jgi:hypothetical protein
VRQGIVRLAACAGALAVATLVPKVPARADVFDVFGDIIDGAVSVVDDVFSGVGALPGVMFAAGVFYLPGPFGYYVPSLWQGVAVNELVNGMIETRHPTDAEYAFLVSIFGNTLPARDRILITNLTGLGGRPFVSVDKLVAGNYTVNLGVNDCAQTPMTCTWKDNTTPGQLFVHEITHVWQLHQASLTGGQTFENIWTQITEGKDAYAYTCGSGWDSYGPEQQANIADTWFANRPAQALARMAQPGSTCEYQYVVENLRKGRLTPRHASSGGPVASVARTQDYMEVWWVDPNGSVQDAWWRDGGTWSRFELAPAGSAAVGGAVAAVSRIPTSMELWWIHPNGSVQGAFWYEGATWARYELAPPGSASATGGITAVSRKPNTMEVWWTGANGSVQAAYWYAGGSWTRYELAPAGSAAASGGIASLSRMPGGMEVWWTGANGSIQAAYWYEGGESWARHEIAPGGQASLEGGITAVSRIPSSMEVWWIGGNGSVQAAYFYDGGTWTRYELAPGGSAAISSNLAATSRIPSSMELWWVSPDGKLEDAHWYEGQPWRRYAMTGPEAVPQAGGLAATSRIPTSMELWASGTVRHGDGHWHDTTNGHAWYEGVNWNHYDFTYFAGTPLFGGAPASGLTDFAREYVYAVRPDGVLAWYEHRIQIDTRPTPWVTTVEDAAMVTTRSAVGFRRQAMGVAVEQPAPAPAAPPPVASPIVTAPIETEVVTQPAPVAQPIVTAPIDTEVVMQPAASVTRPIDTEVVMRPLPPAPRYAHSWQGPRDVDEGWNGFRTVIPAGNASFYALTTDGILRWYRHDGYQDGSDRWSGPIDIGQGWQGFSRIVAGGQGVLYGVAADGQLFWYRHADAMNPSARPTVWGPAAVHSGWGQFAHVFGGGEGVIYAVHPDGRLLWYRHTGYGDGRATWEGPKEIATGWAGFQKVFSPGDGQIYAIHPDGRLSWYRHTGYLNGSPTWEGPAVVNTGWSGLVDAFAILWPPPSDVR